MKELQKEHKICFEIGKPSSYFYIRFEKINCDRSYIGDNEVKNIIE